MVLRWWPVVQPTTRQGGAGSEHQPDEGERLRTLALQAEGPTALSQLPLNHLSYLLGKLRGSDKLWTPAARIGRAFKAGSVARIRLEGGVSGISSEGIPFRNSYYVVLQGPDKSPGFWTNFLHHLHQSGWCFCWRSARVAPRFDFPRVGHPR